MTQAFFNDPRLSGWPFWVLGVSPSASTIDIEKAARDLQAKLQFGISEICDFATPIGICKRDDYLIREAKAKLQSPKDRLLAEFWYIPPDLLAVKADPNGINERNWLASMGVDLWA